MATLKEQLIAAGALPEESPIAAELVKQSLETPLPIAKRVTKWLPTDSLRESKLNMRKTFVKLDELAISLKREGVLVDLIVRPTAEPEVFEIVGGHRRFRAAKLAKLEELPCSVRDYSDSQVFEAQILENVQRSDLNALEEAETYEGLMAAAGYSVGQLAQKTGQSERTIHLRLQLLALGKDGREAVLEGVLPESAATALAGVLRHDLQRTILKNARSRWGDKIPARDFIEFVTREQTHSLKSPPFSVKDADLIPEAGACVKCPKNVANMPAGLFELYTSKALCTDVPCFEAKAKAQLARATAAAEAKGFEVLSIKEGAELFRYDSNLLHDSQYVKLDEPNGLDPKRRTWRQLLEKVDEGQQPPVVVAPDRDLRLHQMVDRKKATTALALVGAKWAEAEVKQKEQRKAETAKIREGKSESKVRRAVVHGLAIRLGDEIAKNGPRPEDWRLIADHFVGDGAAFDFESIGTTQREFDSLLTKVVPTGAARQQLGLVLRFVFATVLRFSVDVSDGYGDTVTALSKRLGVKLADLELAETVEMAERGL